MASQVNTQLETHQLEDYITVVERIAASQVRRLIQHGRIEIDEREDFIQDLLVHVVRQWPLLASTSFTPIGFAKLIIRQKTSNELRKRRTVKATMSRTNGDLSALPTNQADDLLTAIASNDQLSAAIDQLSPEERTLVEMIRSGQEELAIHQLGINKRQLNARRRRIAERLEALLQS